MQTRQVYSYSNGEKVGKQNKVWKNISVKQNKFLIIKISTEYLFVILIFVLSHV